MAFLKGAGLGLVVGGLAAATASLVAPQPVKPAPPSAPQVDVPDTAGAPEPASALLDLTQTQSAPAARTPDQGPDMVPPSDAEAAPVAVTEPAEAPDTPDRAAELNPPAPQSPAQSAPSAEAPVLPNPQSIAPPVPSAEADIEIETAPPAPVVVENPSREETPVVVIATPSDNAAQRDSEDAPTSQIPTREVDITTVEIEDAPASDEGDPAEIITQQLIVDTPPAKPRPTSEATSGDAPVEGSEAAADASSRPLTGTSSDGTEATEDPEPRTEDDADPADAADQAPRTGTDARDTTVVILSPGAASPEADTTDAGAPNLEASGRETAPDQPSKPASRAAEVDPQTGVTVRRPSLGTTEPDAPQSDATPGAGTTDPSALAEFAAFFEGADGLPLLSVVVIDSGEVQDGPRALAEVPFPVTVALDPSGPEATARMRAYRDAGFEVAALASLPTGGTDQDVAVALEGTFTALPETVALVTAQDSLGRSDPATARIASRLAQDGRGLLAVEDGLNGAVSVARAQEVPALTIFRDLREIDQNPRSLRRFIDQAAFRAGQQDGVVLVADLTPNTLSALILWGTANRAGQVALAPLSATLMEEGL